jgi:actin-related protein 5
MQEILPFQSKYKIILSENPSLDAWYGAKEFANLKNLSDFWITGKMYAEMGGEYLKEHSASNKFYPTPMALATEKEVE